MPPHQRPAAVVSRAPGRPVRWVIAALVGAVACAGLFVRGVVGGVLLVAVAAVLATLSLRVWPVLPPARRTARLLVLFAVVVVAGLKLISRA